MEKTPTIIDLTPLWVGILPALLAALEDGTEEGKRMAREELKHMAQVADLARDAAEQRDNMLEVVRWVAAIGFHKMPAGECDCSCSRCDMVRKANAILDTIEGKKNA